MRKFGDPFDDFFDESDYEINGRPFELTEAFGGDLRPTVYDLFAGYFLDVLTEDQEAQLTERAEAMCPHVARSLKKLRRDFMAAQRTAATLRATS